MPNPQNCRKRIILVLIMKLSGKRQTDRWTERQTDRQTGTCIMRVKEMRA